MHDLFLELDMFCPSWKLRFASIRDAATAAGVEDLYREWLATHDGMRYTKTMHAVPDTVKANEQARIANDIFVKWMLGHQLSIN